MSMYDTYASRRHTLLREMDAFYKSLETTERRQFPLSDMIVAMERELIEELGRVTYEIHRLNATI